MQKILVSAEIVNFLCSSCRVLWFGSSMRTMLMCSAVLTPSQGLLSVPCSATQQVHKKLGGSRIRTADPKWPQGYSTPWNARLSTPAGRISQKGLITAQELAGHPQQVVSIVLCTTCEVLFLSLSLSFLLLLLLLLLYYISY